MRYMLVPSAALLLFVVQGTANVLVEVNEGTLEGTYEQNEYGGSFYSFKAIPYALPPVGDLRFKAPLPPTSWQGVRSAKEVSSVCYQVNLLAFEVNGTGSEDCLYLNVYTPDVNPTELLPVMFWIHGGGFFSGNGGDMDFGPEFLVRHDVVYVAINYRLDILGFLSLDIEEVPGNAGLKDQAAALLWVKDNIRQFGGDPDKVTIFGESAGAASVTYHMISPMSKGLFKRAIAQSASPIAHWPRIMEPREKAITFARKLGFTSTDPHEIYEYLKSLPVETIVKLSVPVTIDEQAIIPMSTNFATVIEKDFGNGEAFLTEDLIEALEKGIHEDVDVMSGYTEHEGIFGLVLRGHNENVFKYGEFLEFFCPLELRYHCNKKQILEIGRQMRNRYINDDLVTEEKIWDIITYLSLEDFMFDAIRWQKIIAQSGSNKFYFYKFTCKSELNIMTDLFGMRGLLGPGTFVTHADDLMYLFPPKLYPIEVALNSTEFRMIETVTTLWTNFAKYGNPTPDESLGAHWAPYTIQNQDYLDIGEQLVPGTEPDKEHVEFWEEIYKKYLPERSSGRMDTGNALLIVGLFFISKKIGGM
ncbi:juvenile hormone esterase-like [Cydia strobilella]|uniref:juvenile hormone esterase-like n=1 Tax=Cydia strobilella TaxID=1100964 RepID=UPI0030048A3E